MPSWTNEQIAAITARNCNLLVSAAAGSGKTAVLVERIIRLVVEDGIDIDRLLIVTFTHAAAGEMRERIGSALLEQMEKDEQHAAHLRRQANLLGRSSISTIHAFCTEVVRRHFHLIDIDPNFRVCDQIEADLLKRQVMEELLEAEYEKGSDTFLELVEMFGTSRDDTALADLIIKVFGFMQSQPYPLTWLKERTEDFHTAAADFYNSPWYEELVEQIDMELTGASSTFAEALRLAQAPGGPVTYADVLNHDLSLIAGLENTLREGLDKFLNQLPGIKHLNLPRVSGDIDPALKDRAQSLRNAGKKILNELKKKFCRSLDEYLQDISLLYPRMQCLYRLEEQFTVLYHNLKMEKNLVDFNDLEHYALKILAEDGVAREYQKQFEYIFVDEYQDSNLVQETILNYIKREHNLFMVGDVKQSIYRFRLADPGLFIDKYHHFEESESALNRRITLSSNFRSQKGILAAVNYIFSNIMSRDFGEIDYDEKSRLNPGAVLPSNADEPVELFLIGRANNEVDSGETMENADEVLEEMSSIEAEAYVAAGRIKGLLQEQIFDREKGEWRKVEFRDIAILMRTTKNWSGVFQEVFTAEGIPAFADVNGGYFEAPEVDLMLNLLTLIDNRRQDIPLLSIMRSPIGGFELSELIAIRTNAVDKSYFDAIQLYLDNQDDSLAQKLAQFMKALERWREESRFMHLDDFIWKLLMETGYYYYAGAMPGGRQRQANLTLLVDKASQYQQTSMQGLFNFIKFIERLKSGSSEVGTARLLGENENVVRIMSIHKSKGLEFPIVILVGLGKKFNLTDSSAAVLLHKDMGIGPRCVDIEKRTSADTIIRLAMKQRIKMENLAEEMRILYVGATRPRERLIMIGSIRNMERAAEKWSQSISPFSLAHGQNYLDWIGPILYRHPNGEAIRPAGLELKFQTEADESRWKITLVNSAAIIKERREQASAAHDLCQRLADFTPGQGCSNQKPAIEFRLNWCYPHLEATRLPSKLSVTRIKDLKAGDLDTIHMDKPYMIKRNPMDTKEPSISARERGTIMHFVMQHLDFARTSSAAEIKAQIEEMVERELLLAQAADTVDIYKIMQFCQSELGRRVRASEHVNREVPFNLRCSANQIFGNMDIDEELLIQGVIDLVFKEGNKLVLVDFKTDRVTPDNYDDLVNQYQVQVDLYRQALETINSAEVKESYIYFFDTAAAVPV
jgi:ATP-dependent helicase/nuclease subunit A